MKDKTNLTGLNPDNFRSVINGKDTGLYILRNGSGMEMCVTNYGAIVLSIMAPDSHGKFENVVIGFDTLEEARRQSKDYYIGATIGPVAGRILHGAFRVGEKDYHLQLNSVSNTLHSRRQRQMCIRDRWCGKHSNRVKTNFSSGISMPMEKPVFRAMLR